jgi:hypothetical protein
MTESRKGNKYPLWFEHFINASVVLDMGYIANYEGLAEGTLFYLNSSFSKKLPYADVNEWKNLVGQDPKRAGSLADL